MNAGQGGGRGSDKPLQRTSTEGVAPRRPSRFLLSLFFVIHFGAIGVYVLPFGPGLYDRFPEPVAEVAERATVSLKYRGLLPALGYLNLFSLQQHWTLFGPEPVRWATSIGIEAYFPVAPDRWETRQYRVVGPRETPGLKLGRHREWRILSNLGLQGWGDFYRPLMAEQLCQRLTSAAGAAPSGLTLTATWYEVPVPWESEPAASEYEQHLGGFDCSAEAAGGATREATTATAKATPTEPVERP